MKKTNETILCPACQGEVLTPPCPSCNGTALIEHERRVVYDREESAALIEAWLTEPE
jgi:hypothetical protein